jgi:hypothetical protein
MRYELIVADSPSQLNEIVTARLSEGWELYGNPIMAVTITGAVIAYAQAITRYRRPHESYRIG